MYKINLTVKDLTGFSFSVEEMDKVLQPDNGDSAQHTDSLFPFASIPLDAFIGDASALQSAGKVTWADRRNPPGPDEVPTLREQLIADSAKKPIRHFTQHDYFINADGSVDHYSVYNVPELRNCDSLRVQVPSTMSYRQAIFALEEILESIRSDMNSGAAPSAMTVRPLTNDDVKPF